MVIILIIIGVIAVVGMLGYIFLSNPTPSRIAAKSSVSNSPTANSLAVPVKDFAPNIPMSQKTTVLIQTSDSSDIKYIVPTDQVSTYVKSLPEGYHVVSKSP